jgi:serine/threonine kinase PknH
VDGTPFGRYRLIELLGRGGMGEVWRAHDTATDRIVALKVLPEHMSQDRVFQERFRREAHAAAGLNSPHVIPIHFYGEIDGRLFVDMRLIEGRDLQQVLYGGPLELGRAVHIIEQVARALHAAHQVGLVHRDVKPSNILLDADDYAYLIDFGIARSAGEKGLTTTGGVIGSWNYMAPERFSAQEADARADVYALACVLYECLTGHTPYPGDSLEQQWAGHIATPPPRPSSTNPHLPADLDGVTDKGLAKDPDLRYSTPVELANAARDAITVPIPRPKPTPRRPPTEPASRPLPTPAVTKYRPQPPLSPWAPAATQGAVEPVAPHLADFGSDRQPFQPVPTMQPQRRAGLIAAIVATVVVLVSGLIGITGYLLLKDPHAAQTPTAQPAPPSSPSSSTPQPPPPPPNALDGLLLSVDQINTAMGTTGMTSVGTLTTMPDHSNWVSDKACLPLAFPAEPNVYAGSGSSAMRIQVVQKPPQSGVTQAVVLFSSRQDAGSFFTASGKSWAACSNRQFTIALNGNSQLHTVGPVSNASGTLSATVTPAGSIGVCERALTVANIMAIDVSACGGPSGAAVNIAHQIAAKVPT